MPPELYDYKSDPREEREISTDYPEVVKELQNELLDYAKSPEASWGGPEHVTVGEMEAAQLRALGYVVDPHAPPGKTKIGR